ncbi:hypothetical protein X943_000725 [Babesia divergens]|uniref:ELM2 domain-containing protein n=1 Tax=Babesia divergens TaxID=32595 RepID=A0AAD9GA94_BABDI|nr:hypothetical protein X943_000725 [Babesia divergens]
MDKPAKRQWMQSVNGKIRVGPNYQAMIPPFCRTIVPNNGAYEGHITREQPQTNGSTTNGVSKSGDGDSKNMAKVSSSAAKNDKIYLLAEDFLISK